MFDINKGLVAFAKRGEWQSFVDILAGIVKENFAVRGTVEGEKVVQSTLVALLTAAKGPYLVRHEREAGGGFYDIALEPQLSRWPEIAHAALIDPEYWRNCPLMYSMTNFTDDPAALYRWRDEMADLIEEAAW